MVAVRAYSEMAVQPMSVILQGLLSVVEAWWDSGTFVGSEWLSRSG